MDPQIVKQFDEGLYDLNLSVRETDQTFLDVLGPMAIQIKEKIAKENNTAATNQNNLTNQLQQTYSKAKTIADRQQQLYKTQLQRRGYEIDQFGKEIKTSTELSATQEAYLDKLDKEIQKENELLSATKEPVKKFRELAGSTNSLDGFIKILEDKMYEMTGKSVGGAIALQGTIAAVSGITKAFSAMTDAIWQGERGASVGAKGANELSKAMTTAAYGISAALLALPGGPLLKVVAVALAGFTAAVEGATKLVEMGAKLNDDLYKSYNTLSEKGVTTAKGMNGLYKSLHNVGLAAANIDKLNKLLGDNSKNMSIFGGTVAAGAEKFEKVANAITTPTSAINKQFLLMGINSDAQREHIMKYLAEEERLGLSKGISDAQQIKNAQKYIENLDRLTSLTGTNRKELEEARATVMANENLRAAIFEAEQDKTEEGKARLAELKRFYEAAAMLQAAGDTRGATGIAEYAAGRGITGKASATAFIQFGGKSGLIEKAKKGASAEELAEAANLGYQRQMEMMADTKRIGGDTSGLMTGTFAQGQEFGSRIKELSKKAKEAGYTSVTDYIDAETEARKNSKDETTKKNAEVRQLQEQTAMKLDDAAKFMDGAALGIASSMKLFNEAVELFTDATNKVAKEKGLAPIKKADPEALTREIKQLKDSLRIKNQSLSNLDPKFEMNADAITRLKIEIDTISTSLANAEKRKIEADKIEIVLKGGEKETPEYIAEQMRKGAISPDGSNKVATRPGDKGTPEYVTQQVRGITISPDAANMPIPSMTVPTPGPGVQVASTASTLPKTTESLFNFGSRSGSKSNFEALSDGIKNRIINAAKEFNSMTGNKIAVNSAKRDPEDQQRVWDESVKAGRPGISPTGMAIAKPGMSKHERGLAIDIQNYNDPTAVAAMNRQGLFQTVKNDPVHFEAARTGAMFEGPKEGYFVQLHGKEFVGNEYHLSAIKKLIEIAKEKGSIKGVESAVPTVETEFDNDESTVIIEKFTNMMQSKADELLEKIKFGNRVDSDLLNYSQG